MAVAVVTVCKNIKGEFHRGYGMGTVGFEPTFYGQAVLLLKIRSLGSSDKEDYYIKSLSHYFSIVGHGQLFSALLFSVRCPALAHIIRSLSGIHLG